MTSFTPIASLAGGVLIGIGATILLLFNGRILGISGILAGIVSSTDRAWRALFVGTLVVAGAVAALSTPTAFGSGELADWPVMIAAGVCVGVGTRMGAGCTSGHGVCGLPRLSLRSLVATLTFMGAGILTVAVMRHVFGVAS